MTASRRRIKTLQILGTDLTAQDCVFVTEYVKDLNHRRAAEVAGLRPEKGLDLLEKANILGAISRIMHKRMEDAEVDAECIRDELWDNHFLARQSGNINASNTALGILGKLASVDAFAAEKVHMVGDEEVVARLQRARQRTNPVPPETATPLDLDNISFL
jgi:hypothetical protein